MARRKHHEEHANHEAWAIPYADLMTLLLAFFVVMYAISSLNEGKYRIMADALTTAFGGAPRTINPVQVGNQQVQGGGWDSPSVIKAGTKIGPSAPAPSNDPTLLPAMASQMRMPVSIRNQEQLQRAERQLNGIADKLTATLAPLIERGMITVRRTELWIEVEINSDILFPTGSATLDVHARDTLSKLAEVLRDAPNGVRVEGHTDNIPIATSLFPSNWELSAGRAASVVHLFADQGLQPARLAMVGYGQFRPREDNASAEGRNRNRRVMVIILADTAQSIDPITDRLSADADAADAAKAPASGTPVTPIAPVQLPPLTRAFGVPLDPPPQGVLELFAAPPAELSTLAHHSDIPGLDYVCAQAALATLERRSANQPGLGLALQNALGRHQGQHDYILLDCAPTLGLLMINALAAADRLIIPTQAEPLALHGLDGMVRTGEMVERSRRRPLPMSILPTLFDRRTRAGNETVKLMQDKHGHRVWEDAIPVDTRICNAASLTVPPQSEDYPGRGLAAYRRALEWILADDAQQMERAA